MGGLKWEALEMVCAKLGIEDPDWLIDQLVALRNYQNAEIANG